MKYFYIYYINKCGDTTNVVHTHFAPYPGQGHAGFYEMTRLLSQEGVTVTAIAPQRPGEKKEEIIQGVTVVRIPVSSLKKKSLSNASYIMRCAHLLKKMKPDIGHIYSSLGMGIIPLYAHSDTVWIRDIRSLNYFGGLRAKFADWTTKIESYNFDALIALDEILFHKLFGFIPDNCFVVPLGANFQKFYPGRNDLLRKKLDILDDICLTYIGSMDEKRHLSTVLTAFSQLCTTFDHIKLLMIGKGSDLNNLKKLSRKLHINDRTIFTGYVPFDSVPEYLRASDIGLAYIPDTPGYNVQLLSKTVEYLACSLPLVATATRGNKKFITHEENGILCKDTAASLADAVATLLEDTLLRKKISSRARESVKEYDWRTLVKDTLLPVYETLLERRSYG